MCLPRRPIQHGNFVQHVYRAVRHKHSGERQRVKQALGNGLKVGLTVFRKLRRASTFALLTA